MLNVKYVCTSFIAETTWAFLFHWPIVRFYNVMLEWLK